MLKMAYKEQNRAIARDSKSATKVQKFPSKAIASIFIHYEGQAGLLN